jgi:hypothetical protein
MTDWPLTIAGNGGQRMQQETRVRLTGEADQPHTWVAQALARTTLAALSPLGPC